MMNQALHPMSVPRAVRYYFRACGGAVIGKLIGEIGDELFR